jgi:hypothetical protein
MAQSQGQQHGRVVLACRNHARITHVKRGGRRHCHVGSAASDEQAGCDGEQLHVHQA